VRELKTADFVGHALKFGPVIAGVYSGVEAKADLSSPPADKLMFSIDVTLAGSDAMTLLPLASLTRATMKSNWPHPQFQGAFLPAGYSIDNDGFAAKWQVLELNRAFSQSWKDDSVDESKLQAASFGVGLFQSVDVYQRSERAVKYALMFIALTFLSFYAWELLNASAIHPMQYLLVGLALSTFYLLLIALTEHLAFWLAYWLGAIALAALLGVYIAGALGSQRRGLIIATLMTLVYGLLYLLVLSENYSLLMGAIALFAALATVMLATRHVRWYAAE
jgi:inner membrane protein